MSVFYDLSKTPRNILNQAIVRAIVSENGGALFDPSDLSTLYQDAAGTIPVTAVEQPVGKMLDKSGNGYHATQSITASRPVLSARYNLLTKTNPDASLPAGWLLGFGTGTYTRDLASGFAPLISHNAIKNTQTVAGRSFQYQTVTLLPNTTYTASVYVDKAQSYITSGTTAIFSIANFTITDVLKTLSDADANGRISLTFTTGSDVTGDIRIGVGIAGDSVGQIVFTGYQLKLGSVAGPYQRVNTATDYDTDERYFKKFLRFDGVDDYLNLPYMGLYAGGSASVVAALNSTASTQRYLIEGNTASASPWYGLLRNTNGNLGGAIVDDTSTQIVGNTCNPAFNINHVFSVVDSGSTLKTFDNSNLVDSDVYSRSGKTVTLNTTTIGAFVSTIVGSFSSMNLYSLIITKSALTDSQRIACERYLGRKAGVQL